MAIVHTSAQFADLLNNRLSMQFGTAYNNFNFFYNPPFTESDEMQGLFDLADEACRVDQA